MVEGPVLVTGGAGFIGSALVRRLIEVGRRAVVNVDCLTYAGSLGNVESVADDPLHRFEQVNICDAAAVARLFEQYRPAAVAHLAAESHVDRSISGPADFIRTNVLGTYTLLEAARDFHAGLDRVEAESFRFLHVSTDEVYGALGDTGHFTEETSYDPRSPYSASKAGSDHLVRAWHHTYGLPILITNCSNNYGPHQYPEKLIPVVVSRAAEGKPIPVYGEGLNVRDWLHVEDHVDALLAVLERGRVGETYNVGGGNERRNIDLVRAICDVMDGLSPKGAPHDRLITFVTDRPGHDWRYAIDASKLKRELGWLPRTPFDVGLRETVAWYLDRRARS